MIKLANNNSFTKNKKKLKRIKTYEALKFFYLSFLRKFKKLNSRYKFTAAMNFTYINKQLKNINIKKKSVFFGIPFGIKDVFNTKYLKTEFGSILFKNFLPGNNARIVDIIKEKQGIIFCKTTTAEFAVHHFPEKKTLNPYSSKHITGTSSAGSAVAVACGALPVSLATQTAGSIIRPASFCGVIGFKPSFGALDRTGVLKTTDTLDTVGLFSYDINFLKKIFTNLIQHDDQYPYSKNFFDKYKYKNKNIRIGIVTDIFKQYKCYDELIKKDFNIFCDKYLKKYQIVNCSSLNFINLVHEHHNNIYCKSLSYYFKHLSLKKKKLSKIMKNMMNRGYQIKINQYKLSCNFQNHFTKKFEKIINNFDFLITPSTASTAPKIGGVEKSDTSLIWTFFGVPAISLPIFFDEKTGLPFGLQIIAPRYKDFALLDFSERIIKDLIKNKISKH
jgi:Asp-tRNA(Asn)/Glu-tRNA(Gln) amidotransferase A subunit family amidase